MRSDANDSWIRSRFRSFGYAARGIVLLFRYQTNAVIHLTASVFVVAAGLWLGLSADKWTALVFAMGLVLMAEAMNSAVEWLADAIHPGHHPLIGRAKDVAAGGVLIAAIAAAVIGILVFWAPLLERMSPSE